jgi:hypothetical protein
MKEISYDSLKEHSFWLLPVTTRSGIFHSSGHIRAQTLQVLEQSEFQIFRLGCSPYAMLALLQHTNKNKGIFQKASTYLWKWSLWSLATSWIIDFNLQNKKHINTSTFSLKSVLYLFKHNICCLLVKKNMGPCEVYLKPCKVWIAWHLTLKTISR